MELKYSKNINANIDRSYFKIEDNNIHKLILKVKITKLIFFRYFNSQ